MAARDCQNTGLFTLRLRSESICSSYFHWDEKVSKGKIKREERMRRERGLEGERR